MSVLNFSAEAIQDGLTIVAMTDRFFLFSFGAALSLIFFILPWPKPILTHLFEFITAALERKLNRTERHAASRRTRGLLVILFLLLCTLLISRLIDFGLSLSEDMHLDNLWIQSFILSLFIGTASFWKWQHKIMRAIEKNKNREAANALAQLTQDDIKATDIYQMRRLAIAADARIFERYFIGPWFWFIVGGYFFLALYTIFTAFKFTTAYRHEHARPYAKWGILIDEILNFIPARLAAILLLLGTILNFKTHTRHAFRGFIKYRNILNNINAGQTLSLMSGAVQTLLAGPQTQRKINSSQPWIGDGRFTARPDAKKVSAALSLLLTTTLTLILLAILPAIYLLFYI